MLEPVALGTPLTETPLQITELLNVGEASLSYVVDLQGIIDANSAQGHGVPVSIFCAPLGPPSKHMKMLATTPRQTE